MIALRKSRRNRSKDVRRSPSRTRCDSLTHIEFVPHPRFLGVDAEEFVESLNPGTLRLGETHALPMTAAADCLLLSDAPLLTRDEERYLFCRMNYLKFTAARSLAGLRARRERRACVFRRLHTANSLRNYIVEANQRLVVSIARGFVTHRLTLGDLVSDGNLPLIRAVELYDFSRGLNFSTYATHAVRNYLVRGHRRSLDRNRRECVGMESALATVIDDGSNPHAMVQAAARRHRLLEQWLGELGDRERAVVASRFGLDDGKQKSYRQIGQALGFSKERARQIAHRSLEELQQIAAERANM